MDHPGAGLLGSGGQIGLQLQGVKARPRQGVQPTLVLPDGLQQLRGRLGVELLKLRLDLGVEEDRVGRRHHRLQFGYPRLVGEHRLVAVEHIQKRLGGQQVQFAEQTRIDFRARGEQGGALVEELPGCDSGIVHGLTVLVVAGLLLQPRQGLVQRLQVGEDQLGLDDLDVGARIDMSVDVHDVVVGEHPHDLADGVALANVGQELVAQPRTLGGALDDSGDVDERHRRRQDALRTEHLGQRGQPGIRQRHDALVGLDGGEGIIRGQHVIAGQRVEKG